MFTGILGIKKNPYGSNVKNIRFAIVIDYPHFSENSLLLRLKNVAFYSLQAEQNIDHFTFACLCLLYNLTIFSKTSFPRFRVDSGCKYGSRKKPPYLTGTRRQPYRLFSCISS